MRFPLYSLKTGIVVCLSLLIVSAMLLINVVMIKFAERDLIDAKIKTGYLLIQAIGQRAGYEMARRGDSLKRLASDLAFKREIHQILEKGGFSKALMVSAEGVRLFSVGPWKAGGKDAFFSCTEALRTGHSFPEFFGETWGVIWFSPESVRISSPVVFKGYAMGAVSIGGDLDPLYQGLRTSEDFVLGYICLNTVILVLFGIYLLSRTVIRPIRRLLTITEKFEEWPTLVPAGESSRNEFGQLFRSLKMMLNRLEANKRELKDTIASLTKANLEIKKAQDDLDLLRKTLANQDGNDTQDTSPTFKVLEEGATVLSREEVGKLAQRQAQFIKHLQAALVRIENKTYGICRQTGKLISKERLRAVPHATLSIEAKNMQK